MVKKTVVIVMGLTLLSKVIGFLRDIILAYFYGASTVSDAFLISLVIPSVIFGFIGTGIYTSYIPMYSQIEEHGGKGEADKFTRSLIGFLLLFSTAVIAFGLLFTEPLVKLFASGFKGKELELTVSFTKMTLFSMYSTSLIFIVNAYLQIKGRQAISGLMGLPLNFVLISSIVLSAFSNHYFLAAGQVAAALAQLLFLLFFAVREGFVLKPAFHFSNRHLRTMFLLAGPVILSSSVDQINKLVDRTIASNLSVGGISALNYANQLNLFVLGIFVASITVVFYPIISRMAAEKDYDGVRKALSQTVIAISILIIPITIAAVIFARPIIEILFGRGAFSEQAVEMTSAALLFYSIGMAGAGLREILTRGFFSLQDTMTPMKNSVAAVSLNIVLNFALAPVLGIGGLALATSISSIVCTFLLFKSMEKKLGFFEKGRLFLSFGKILAAALFMGLLMVFLHRFLGQIVHPHVSFICSSVAGGLFYLLCLHLLKIKEFEEFVFELKTKIDRVYRAG